MTNHRKFAERLKKPKPIKLNLNYPNKNNLPPCLRLYLWLSLINQDIEYIHYCHHSLSHKESMNQANSA